jgi:DNA-binding protein WhiA
VNELSFSSLVKNELCRTDIRERCCLLSELAAVVEIGDSIAIAVNGEANIKVVTENAAFARRVFSLVKELFDIYPEVLIRKSKKLKKHTSYTLVITSSKGAKKVLESLGISCTNGLYENFPGGCKLNLGNLLRRPCCRKAYLRGAFLAGGSISDPEKTYHMEITSHDLLLVTELNRLMGTFRLNGKVISRKGNYIIYLKEGDNIVDFLNIIGAHTALMELENIRILKEMRNNVNRIVNCETANLEKTVDASVRQVDNIRYIRDTTGLGRLPRNLSDIAELRLQYPDASLKELGDMLTPPLGKSGVNHRLRKLDKIAESERNSKKKVE